MEAIEVYRTRKGRITLDEPTNLYTVWLRRPDGLELQRMETKHYEIALAFLKDDPGNDIGGGQ